MPKTEFHIKAGDDPDDSFFRSWLDQAALACGFDGLRITDTDLGQAPEKLRAWLAEGRHGQMHYMEQHATIRSDPQLLQPGAVRVI